MGFYNYGHKAGTDRFYHDAQHPPHILLPVVRRNS
jgi:hypothetical protein